MPRRIEHIGGVVVEVGDAEASDGSKYRLDATPVLRQATLRAAAVAVRPW
jgi:hypothetical protein